MDQEGTGVDGERFDEIARAAATGSRRRLLKALAAGVLAGPAALLGREEAAAGCPRGKKRCRGRCIAKDRCCGGCPKCHHCDGGRCVPNPVPLCDPEQCQQAFCDVAANDWTCESTCGEGDVCCNGHCEPACTNGCDPDPGQACLCEKPPAGKTYCSAEHTCVDGQTDPNHCGSCGNACAEGEPCVDGQCKATCPSGETPCGDVCCAKHEACRDGACVAVCPSGSGGVHNGSFVACEVDGGIQCHCNACGTRCRSGEACCSVGCRHVVTTCADHGF